MTDTPIYHDVCEWILRSGRADTLAWDTPTVSRFPMPAEMFIDWPEVSHTHDKHDSLFRPALVAATGERSRWAA